MNWKKWLVVLALLLCAAGFRLGVAHFLPNDEPDDGRVYAQLARNVLEQHVYSLDTGPSYLPTLIRLPGYPLFLAGVYSIFGHTQNSAVRMVQALIDTGTCVLVALLAFFWDPDEQRKLRTAVVAFVLAAMCPFTTIYVATILTETPTSFLAVAMCLTATLALRTSETHVLTNGTNKRRIKAGVWWGITGLWAGIAVMFRPDSGLFAAAIGITLVISGGGPFWRAVASGARDRFGSARVNFPVEGEPKRRRRFALPAHSREYLSGTFVAGTIFSLGFLLALAPWTIRNFRVFHLIQPLAPAHAEMPGEFVPRGYFRWLRTWVDDERYIAPLLWAMDSQPINLEDIPNKAFDSAAERQRVADLLAQYNHPPDDQSDAPNGAASVPSPTPEETPKSGPGKSSANKSDEADSSSEENADEENSDEGDKNSGDQGDENDAETDQGDEEKNQEPQWVEMTPPVDAGFAQLAQERIARHPLRYYFWLPLRRAAALWFDTHSRYYPFQGELFGVKDHGQDEVAHQEFWLRLFAALTWAYTLLGVMGGLLLWQSRDSAARKCLLLVGLVIFLRLAFFSTMENPEPRYVVEIFPFLAVLGGIAITRLLPAKQTTG
ncbi:MAG: glycosyltransferase family 39 protein [Pyrinomonadaceae bacterium]